jgi:hypothetical protein
MIVSLITLTNRGHDQADGRSNATCGDALRRHQADGWCLTSNL